jgi:hypothetical protein
MRRKSTMTDNTQERSHEHVLQEISVIVLFFNILAML